MSDRWLRMFTVRELVKYSFIHAPILWVSGGFFVAGVVLTRIAIYRNRHVENDGFKRYKYKYVTVRPDNPYIQWFHQSDTAEEYAQYQVDVEPYANKYNKFLSMPESGKPMMEMPPNDQGVLGVIFVGRPDAKICY